MKRFLPILLAFLTFVSIFCGVACAEDDIRASDEYVLLKEFVSLPQKRVYGESGSVAAGQFIEDCLRSYGFGEDALTRQPVGDKGDFNVVASLQGDSDLKIVLGAHYDTVAKGEGAADNGAGVATLLLAARDLLNASVLPLSVDVVFFTGEEVGLLGSHAYVAALSEKQLEEVAFMINLDVIAEGDFLYVCCEETPTDLQALIVASQPVGGEKILTKPSSVGVYANYDLWGRGFWEIAQNSDNTPFRLAGVPTALIFSGNYGTANWGYVESADKSRWMMNGDDDTFENLENNCGSDFVFKMNAVRQTVVTVATSKQTEAVANSARSQLTPTILHSQLIPRLVALFVAALAFLAATFYVNSRRASRGKRGGRRPDDSATSADDIFNLQGVK